jgi:hypothetical protein
LPIDVSIEFALNISILSETALHSSSELGIKKSMEFFAQASTTELINFSGLSFADGITWNLSQKNRPDAFGFTSNPTIVALKSS